MTYHFKLKLGFLPECSGRITIDESAEAIPAWAKQILSLGEKIMAKLADLEAQVKANTTVVESAMTLIAGIAQRIVDAGGDPAKLDALVTELQTEDQKLADAMVTNTPSARM
jgi:hypothetical protein